MNTLIDGAGLKRPNRSEPGLNTKKETTTSLDVEIAESEGQEVSIEVFTISVMQDEYENTLKELEKQLASLNDEALAHQNSLKLLAERGKKLVDERTKFQNYLAALTLAQANIQLGYEAQASEA